MCNTTEIREKFARVHETNSKLGKIRRLAELGRINEATKIADTIGEPLARGVIVRIHRAKSTT